MDEPASLPRFPMAIVGPGALGLLFAQALSKAMRVAVVARCPERARELRAGVMVGEATFHPEAFGPESAPRAERILILVKAPHTAVAANAAAAMDPRAVLSLQNGLVEDILRNALPGVRAAQGVTSVPAYRDGARIVPGGRGETLVPPGFDDFVEALRSAGFEARVEPDIRRARLLKLLVNACINPLTAVHGVRNGELLDPRFAAALRDLASEAAAVLRHEGVALEADAALDRVLAVARATAGNRSSMLQDLEAGRETEIGFITGALIGMAARHGVPLPTHQALYAKFHRRARSGVPPPGVD